MSSISSDGEEVIDIALSDMPHTRQPLVWVCFIVSVDFDCDVNCEKQIDRGRIRFKELILLLPPLKLIFTANPPQSMHRRVAVALVT